MSDVMDILANASFWVAVLRTATPLLLGTLGVLLCERAGVLNLGIEGIMVAGAFTGWLTVYAGHGLWTGVLVAALVIAAPLLGVVLPPPGAALWSPLLLVCAALAASPLLWGAHSPEEAR